MKNHKTKVILSLLCGLLIASCARDRDADDYKREKYKEDMAKLQAVEGVYWGELKQKGTGKILGTLSVDLKASGRVTSDISQQNATLRGKVTFKGNNQIKLVFEDSYFDPENSSFSSRLTSASEGTQEQKLDLEGRVENDTLKGTLNIFGFEENGGEFALAKEGTNPAIAGYKTQSLSTLPVENIKRLYEGMGHLNDGNPALPVVVEISNEDLMPVSKRFFDLLSPQKTVKVILNWPNRKIAFLGALWDSDSQQLTGSTITSNIKVSINCIAVEGNTDSLKCISQSSDRSVNTEINLHLKD